MIVRTGGGWLARAAFAVLGLAIAAIAFFALTIAAMIGAVVALVIGVRWWWLVRRARKAQAGAGPIEGEYTVVDREPLDGPR
jgi:hypothetical protein